MKIVVLGMMTNKPVGGIVHLTMPYVVGLERLGHEAYYVEAHARWPKDFMIDADDDGAVGAAAFVDRMMRRFGTAGRWAYHAQHSDGRVYGLSEGELKRLYQSADLILNVHGGTHVFPDVAQSDRLVLIDTDPVGLQIAACSGDREALDFIDAHVAFFSWGENLGNPDCKVPLPDGIVFHPTRVPVLLELWDSHSIQPGEAFTTIGNWQQQGEDLMWQGEIYHWSKHHEFQKFIDMPTRTSQPFELALASYDDAIQQMLEANEWRVRPALDVSRDVDVYRDYIIHSRGEFTVAKDQNVRLRSGWFSDRSATYLAAGRPVITQETGFSNSLPVGGGLFGFSTTDDILGAVDAINSEYERHSRAAREIATEYFGAERVLAALLDEIGISSSLPKPATDGQLPTSLDLQPLSRRPLVLPDETVRAVLQRAVPQPVTEPPLASIIVVTLDNLVFTRLCLESVLANTAASRYELIVVDNGSGGATRNYLRDLSRHDHVHVIFHDENVGFAGATNQGLAIASGDVLVLLNNDTIVPPGWLGGLVRHLQDASIGLVGPVTNRIGNEAQIETSYRTYGDLVEFASERARELSGRSFDVRMLAMFCLAMRRDVYEHVGPLDERYEVGLLEDDDYAMQVHAANLRVVCAEDVFVHHFGEASFGKLVPSGEYNQVLEANRRRFEEKWNVAWEPYERRATRAYELLPSRISVLARETIRPDANVLVVSRGDEQLLRLNGSRAGHFPQVDGGVYAGHYPRDSAEAIEHLETLRGDGFAYLLIPKPALWWLDYYADLARHLYGRYRELARDDDVCVIFDLS